MAKSRREKSAADLSDPDWSILYRFALALEKGRFNDYIELLQDSKKLFWKSLISGIGKGFGAVLGATVFIAVLVWVLGLLSNHLPGKIGEFFGSTQQTIQQPAP